MPIPPGIDKSLFASGQQCAKRLYLDYHHPDGMPAPNAERQEMQEVGLRLVQLARQAFPASVQCDPDDFDLAAQQTAAALTAGVPRPVFDAAFSFEGARVRADVVIPQPNGGIDLFEVKSGTKIKTRYVRDVAFHVHVIERAGTTVHSATILHINAKYRHRGGDSYPVQELFRYADITAKVREQIDRVATHVASYAALLDDPATAELPTGTWCRNPFECGYLPECLAAGPDQPLLHLPGLSRDLETALHEDGVEELGQIDAKQKGLTPVQRRALRALRTGEVVIEPFVGEELHDVDYPLHFVHVSSTLEALPLYDSMRPWQQLAYQWTDVVVHEGGRREILEFTANGKDDPRSEFLATMSELARLRGTLVTWGGHVEKTLRALLEDLPQQKTQARALLHMAHFDLSQLIEAGVYAPEFRGKFDLASVHRTLVSVGEDGDAAHDQEELFSSSEATAAFRRMLRTRTRATTRDKLTEQLQAHGRHRAHAILAIHDALTARCEGTDPDESTDPGSRSSLGSGSRQGGSCGTK